MIQTVQGLVESGWRRDSSIPAAFSVECILPSQFTVRRSGYQPEKRLLLAVLEDAIGCLLGEDARESLDAANWLRVSESATPFGFENICTVLGFDPAWMRRRLLRQRRLLLEGRKEGLNGSSLRFSRAA